MCLYCGLINSIDKLITKADDELEKSLSDAGYVKAKDTVKAITNLEDDIAAILAIQTDELQQLLDKASKKGLSYKELDKLIDKMLTGSKIDKDAAKVIGNMYVKHVESYTNEYIKEIDEDAVCENLRKRTIAEYESWTDSYAKMFKENADKQVKDYIERAYREGLSVSDLAKDVYNYGFREEYWQAKRIAQTELLRCHSFAKDEAIMQSPVCEEKEWIHTGSVKNEPRQNHVDMNGVTVPKADNFPLIAADGKTYYPRFPRDPMLPAKESVNCHCFSRGVVNKKFLKYTPEKKKQLQAKFIEDDNKKWKSEQSMRISVPESIYNVDGIKESHVREINQAVYDLTKEYDVKIDTISVEAAGKGDIMLSGGYLKDDDTIGFAVVINEKHNFNDINSKITKMYDNGVFAGKSLYDYTQHELCHILSVQDCITIDEYNTRLKEIDSKFVKGISGYADRTKKGTESLAEAFVRKRNGESIPDDADKLLEEYVEKWRRKE